MQAADKLMVLQEGKIVQFGTRQAIAGTIVPGEKHLAVGKGSA
jgi:ATP-binding cassette subfamily C protein